MQGKPTTFQRDLAKLPQALAPLQARPQWVVWRWTAQRDRWQKPPFRATAPELHASTKDPSTWADYATALAAAQAGQADGITYVLTESDPFAAMDLDHCRDSETGSIDPWAQNFLDTARHTYSEVTPSGSGVRIWGLTGDGTAPVHRKFSLEIDGKKISAELFRQTPKALTVTGYKLDFIRELTSVDDAFQWALVWGERRKAAETATQVSNGHGVNGHSFGGGGHDVEEIERLVREGAGDANRSDKFHTVVGHLLGCGYSLERIHEHLQQFPEGVAGRYLSEGRLAREIARSSGKYQARTLPLFNGWELPETLARETPEELVRLAEPTPVPIPASTPPPTPKPIPEPTPAPVISDLDDDDPPELEETSDPELEDDDPADAPQPKPSRLYLHWRKQPAPLKSWLIKHLIPACGVGLLSGQNGTGKTFIVFDLLVASLATGQPFLRHVVKRQCGVLLIAAEGGNEVDLRLDAVLREKCGGMGPVPFVSWREEIPPLLHKDAAKALIATAREVDDALQAEFGLPLGLIAIDTYTACAGYSQSGGENNSATGAAIMGVLRKVAQAANCFVLGVHHFGKNIESGTRGSTATEDAADLVLACLGEKQINGSVLNTRLAVRKNRGGPQGEEHPFTLRQVEAPEPDEDGDPFITKVVDWQPAGEPGGARPMPAPVSPWVEGCRQDQRAPMLRLQRALMDVLVDGGVDRPIPPDGPVVRMAEQEVVQKLFFERSPMEPAGGSDTKKQRQRRSTQFKAALGRAEEKRLVGIQEIGGVTRLWLVSPGLEEGGSC